MDGGKKNGETQKQTATSRIAVKGFSTRKISKNEMYFALHCSPSSCVLNTAATTFFFLFFFVSWSKRFFVLKMLYSYFLFQSRMMAAVGEHKL